jgi:acyl dehydratase
MAIDPQRLMKMSLPSIEQDYDWRDCVLYSLGIGVGLDPMDERDLPFVDETRLRLQPSMVNVLGYPGFWQQDPQYGIDWVKVVHGEQSIVIHKTPAVAGRVRGVSRIVDLVDKGAGRGALIYVDRDIFDARTDELLATVSQTVFCRGDGGFGGASRTTPAPHAIPDCAPDVSVDLPTSQQMALIYRLSGDYNPLHSTPSVARAAGFDRPILHGLATFGLSCHGLVKLLCDGDPTALRAMGGRFSAPVFPGETLRVDAWHEGRGKYSFRTRVPARGVIALNNGHFETAV